MELHHKYIDYIKNHYGKYSQSDITSIVKEYESKIFVSNKLDVQLNESKDFDMNIRIDHIRDESQCYDYIKDNDNYENIDNYCENIEIEKNKISPVSQGYLDFLFGNFGLDFGFVNSWWERDSEGNFFGTRIQHVNMALFYQFEF